MPCRWRGGSEGGRRNTKKLTAALQWRLKYTADQVAYLEAKAAPELSERVEPESWFFWQAYHHLRGARGLAGSIPFSEIAAYCEWVGLTCPVMRWRLARIVTALDNAEGEHGRTAANA